MLSTTVETVKVTGNSYRPQPAPRRHAPLPPVNNTVGRFGAHLPIGIEPDGNVPVRQALKKTQVTYDEHGIFTVQKSATALKEMRANQAYADARIEKYFYQCLGKDRMQGKALAWDQISTVIESMGKMYSRFITDGAKKPSRSQMQSLYHSAKAMCLVEQIREENRFSPASADFKEEASAIVLAHNQDRVDSGTQTLENPMLFLRNKTFMQAQAAILGQEAVDEVVRRSTATIDEFLEFGKKIGPIKPPREVVQRQVTQLEASIRESVDAALLETVPDTLAPAFNAALVPPPPPPPPLLSDREPGQWRKQYINQATGLPIPQLKSAPKRNPLINNMVLDVNQLTLIRAAMRSKAKEKKVPPPVAPKPAHKINRFQ